jgi:DNA-binding MurR/RpiR family transcriptional regulator
MRHDRHLTPTDPPSLAERIRLDMDAFTPSEKRAAHLLLSHYPFAGLDTVAEFASRAGISAPSVLRFVTRLGFGGFPDFQRHLREELAALLADPRRHIHFTGGRFTGAVARYAESHFRIVRGGVDFIESQPALWRDRMIEIGRKDVIVAFDIRRYQEDVIALCETAARQGATVVLLTDPWLSPIARVARHVLPAHIAAPSNWDSSAGLLLLVEALIAAVTKRLWDTARPRMEAVERLRTGKD